MISLFIKCLDSCLLCLQNICGTEPHPSKFRAKKYKIAEKSFGLSDFRQVGIPFPLTVIILLPVDDVTPSRARAGHRDPGDVQLRGQGPGRQNILRGVSDHDHPGPSAGHSAHPGQAGARD